MDFSVTIFDLLIHNISNLNNIKDCKVIVTSGDVLLSFDTSKVFFYDLGITGVAYPGPVDLATKHGVYIVSQQPEINENIKKVSNFLQKPTYDELKENNGIDVANKCFIDTGIMSFGTDVIKNSFSFFRSLY